MFIKLKRASRTAQSEEIAIQFSHEDHLGGEEVNIGKLDLHYHPDQIVGTLLIWQEHATAFSQAGAPVSLEDVISTVLSEISEPIGVPSEYGIEVFYPSLAKQDFFSNYADEEEEATDPGRAVGASQRREAEEQQEYEGPVDDEFAKQLRSRPGE